MCVFIFFSHFPLSFIETSTPLDHCLFRFFFLVFRSFRVSVQAKASFSNDHDTTLTSFLVSAKSDVLRLTLFSLVFLDFYQFLFVVVDVVLVVTFLQTRYVVIVRYNYRERRGEVVVIIRAGGEGVANEERGREELTMTNVMTKTKRTTRRSCGFIFKGARKILRFFAGF